VSELEFNVPFQHKHGYIRDDIRLGIFELSGIEFSGCRLWCSGAFILYLL